jgi:D-alanine-D-alanine ligase
MQPTDRVRLVVLFGGQSAEHDVSRVTAAHVLRAVDPARYAVHPIAITRRGEWVYAEAAARALERGPHTLPDVLDASGPVIDPTQAAVRGEDRSRIVVLPLLHGPRGEDGTVQGLLELLDLPYVGSGVLGSAVAMDKTVAKDLLAANGVPVARGIAVGAHERNDRDVERIAHELGLPVFVKPANMGSSVGVTKATTVDEVHGALDVALSFDEVALIEEAIVGREIEVAVLGNDEPRASIAGEIVPSHDFYDNEDKYLADGAKLLIPSPLDEHESDEVRDLALRAFRALRCSGMARVDFLYESGRRGFLCNEVNTIPGFTPISMYPKLWEASGLPYGALIDELVRLALDRHARRRRRTDR